MILKKKITPTFLLFSILVSAFCFATLGQSARLKKNASVEGGPPATAPILGMAGTFAVLAASAVTNTGPTILTGDLGVNPGTSIIGFPPGIVLGSIFVGEDFPVMAQLDVGLAFADLNLRDCTSDLTGEDLADMTLTPGVYCFDASAPLSGTLTLNAQGDPNAAFIFQIGSTLITSTNSSIVLINGATACQTFFAVGSSATLGTGTQFEGNILALASVTLTTGAKVNGLVAAQTAAVTMDTNDVSTCSILPPSAATVNVAGRITDSSGRGILGVRVRLMDNTAGVRWTTTSSFGFYSFADVEVGQSLLISVSHKRYQFTESERIIVLNDEISNVDFIAN